MENFKDILPKDLKDGLTDTEETLLGTAQKGWQLDFRIGDKEKDDPKNAAAWAPERTIRAELISWLCTDKAAAELVHAHGIVICGAKVSSPPDFEGAVIPHRLALFECALETVTLADASARTLAFNNSIIGGFVADRLRTSGSLLMNDVKAAGEVRLLGADIGGDLVCDGADFDNPKGYALSADRITVKGSVFLRKAKAVGEVRLLGADIGGDLSCINAEFNNPEGYTLNADGIKVTGSVFLRNGFKAIGEVRLLGADIGQDLECSTGAVFNNPGGKAISADGVNVKGTVFLKEVKAKGEVRLLGADIGGDLECIGAEFNNPEGYTLNADGIKVKGSVFLSKVKATGEVRLLGADIGGNLECTGAEFNNPSGCALDCENANIKGSLFLSQMKGLVGALYLTHAKVGALLDDKTGWPEKGKLYIDGFEYGGLPGDTTPKTAVERLEWLRMQPTKDNQNRNIFYPRPYEQLAKVFKDMGQESDARAILIAKQDDLREHGNLSRKAKYWNCFLGITIGHGWQPWKVILFWIVPFLLVGAFMFGWADHIHVMQPTKERVYMLKPYKDKKILPPQYPRLEPMIYSIDSFVPFVNLHQQDYWLPDATKKHGWIFRIYHWFHIAMGWFFSTLAAASLTGLVRRLKE